MGADVDRIQDYNGLVGSSLGATRVAEREGKRRCRGERMCQADWRVERNSVDGWYAVSVVWFLFLLVSLALLTNV